MIVPTLWNELLLELSLDFSVLCKYVTDIEDLHEDIWCWKKYVLTNLVFLIWQT